MEDSEFLCPDIRTEYEKDTTGQTTHHKEDKVTLLIWTPSGVKANHNKIARRVFKLVKWISKFPYSHFDSNKALSILLYLGTQKKTWCSDKKTLTICNVNSGETSFTKNYIEVRVFRREDCIKVLIHELLHAFRWDAVVEAKNPKDRWSWMPNEQEAFIEANARFLYCHVLAKWFPQKTFTQYWQKELEWMKNQANFLRRSRWSTTTNAVAYYLMTIALLYAQNNEFLLWVHKSNKPAAKLREEWISERSKWWNHFYNNQQTFWLPEQSSVACSSLRMVATQVSLE